LARYERLGPERRSDFDAFIASSRWPDFLQSWAWGQVKACTGWRPHRLFMPGDQGRPLAACSVLERRLPGVGPLLYAPRGPIVDWGDPAAAAAALEALAAFARDRRAVALKLDPAVAREGGGCRAALAAGGFRLRQTGASFEGVQPRFVMHLPLAGRDEAALLAGMHPKTRYNIRLAERRGVRVRAGGAGDLAAFYALLRETAQRDGFLIRGPGYFETLYRELVAPGMGWLLLAQAADGELLAAALVFRMGATAWYLYGASSSRRRELMPAYAVQWEAIRLARAAGCTLYDFRGVSGDLSPENPLYGLYRFKRGFGAELVEYVGEWDLVLRPARQLLLEHGLPLARRLLRALRRRGAAPAPAED
jgi:lipid II:glycine glycyltransferase (peptidoglycan interpeptide bridge formation enzyme)